MQNKIYQNIYRQTFPTKRIIDEIAYYNPNENMDDQSEPVQWFNQLEI